MSDRKYRQRGYIDEGGDERPSRGRPRDARPQREGPRGRGLGGPGAAAFRCAVCGRRTTAPAVTETAAACSSCGGDLHTCTHCRHFDSSAPFECRQPVPERIGAKARRNDCELFEARTTQEIGGADEARPDDPRAAFDALFDL